MSKETEDLPERQQSPKDLNMTLSKFDHIPEHCQQSGSLGICFMNMGGMQNLPGFPPWNMPMPVPQAIECSCVPILEASPCQYYCSPPALPSETSTAAYHILSDDEHFVPRKLLEQIPRTKYKDEIEESSFHKTTLTFSFPEFLCGMLIGKGGRNITDLMNQTGCYLVLTKSMDDVSLPLLQITGSREQIQHAWELIELKFPSLSLTEVGESRILPLVGCLDANIKVRQLQMSKDRTDVVVSNIINVGHLYLQMASVTTKAFLDNLQTRIANCYDKRGIPKIEMIPVVGTYCIVKTEDGWFRAQVIRNFAETAEVVLVDFGTLNMVETSSLRKIRSDLLEVPFQAIECRLSNVTTKNGETIFSLAALSALQELTTGKVLEAISKAGRDGIPCVELFVKEGSQAKSVNRQLVHDGLVKWTDILP